MLEVSSVIINYERLVLDLFRTHVKYITQQVIERAFLLVANRGQFIRKCDKILKAAETHYKASSPFKSVTSLHYPWLKLSY